jgi:hypothetical protein
MCVDEGNDKVEYHLHNGFLYKVENLYVPKGEILYLIREANTSKILGNFGVGKIVANLQRYVYWPILQKDVAKFIRGFIICCTMNPRNRNQGLYHPLPIPTRPWDNNYIDCVSGFRTTRKRHDYLF